MLIKNMAILEKNGIYALFNPFFPKPVFVNNEELQRFLCGDLTNKEKGILSDHFLIESAENEKTLEKFQEIYAPEKEIMTLYVILTRTCNLKCSYCFEVERQGVREYDQQTMTTEIAQKAIDIFADEIRLNKGNWNYQIIFYGGEPMLNWKTLSFAVDYIKKLQYQNILPNNIRLAMNTNGTLITEEVAVYLKKHSIAVTVSLDGTQEIHDKHRKDCFGEGTFDVACEGYHSLKKAGVNVCPSVTVSEQMVGKTLEIIKELHFEIGFDGMGINPLMAPPKDFVDGSAKYFEKLSRDLIDCFVWGREAGISEDRSMRKVNSFIDLNPHIADCCAYGQQLVIQPDGSIGICHASKEHNYCTVWNYKNPSEYENMEAWMKRLPIFNKECSSCQAIFLCGGGCAHAAKLHHGDITQMDKMFCLHTKTMLEFLIWDLYERC